MKPGTFRRATVLILALWLVILLTLMGVSILRINREDQAIVRTFSQRTMARWICRAGIHRAIATVMADDPAVDSLADRWADQPDRFLNYDLGAGQFTVYRLDPSSQIAPYQYGLQDQSALINVLTADIETLLALPEMTVDLAEQILLRRDLPQTLGDDPSGQVEQPVQQDSQRRLFRSLDELFGDDPSTRQLLWGEDGNRNGILDPHENDGDLSYPPDDQDGQLDLGWAARLTLYSYEHNVDATGQARLNLHTATAQQLADLPLRPGQVNFVMEIRQFGLQSIADLLSLATSAAPSTHAANRAFGSALQAEALESGEIEAIDLATFKHIVDRITIDSRSVIPGKININTADATVLSSLPAITSDLAAKIVRYRNGLPGGFKTIADLLDVPDVSLSTLRACAERLTIRSSVYGMHCLARAHPGGLTYHIYAVVDRRFSEPVILHWQERY